MSRQDAIRTVQEYKRIRRAAAAEVEVQDESLINHVALLRIKSWLQSNVVWGGASEWITSANSPNQYKWFYLTPVELDRILEKGAES